MAKIERAIVSCHDKTGLVPLVQLLRELQVEIVSTAGTLETLREAGVEACSLADMTGMKEMLGGRVKSLHPAVHAGLLASRDNRLHLEQLQEHEFQRVDMVVVNLRPVDELIGTAGITIDEVMEQIDIGGAAMIASAAKNYRYVSVVVNPERYSTVMHELRAHEGALTFKTRHRLAQEAFERLASYHHLLAGFLHRAEPTEG